MSEFAPLRVWTGARLMTGGYGGWAFVRGRAGAVTGAAGGERRTTLARAELTGLVEALADPDAERPPVIVHAASDGLLTGLRALKGWRIAGWATPDGAPIPDADLWRRLADRLAALGPASIVRLPAPSAARDAASFVHEWASLAADKVRARPTFRAAIPKPNLAAFPG